MRKSAIVSTALSALIAGGSPASGETSYTDFHVYGDYNCVTRGLDHSAEARIELAFTLKNRIISIGVMTMQFPDFELSFDYKETSDFKVADDQIEQTNINLEISEIRIDGQTVTPEQKEYLESQVTMATETTLDILHAGSGIVVYRTTGDVTTCIVM